MRKSIQRQGPMLAALMAALTLTGCAQLEIADRAVAYNKAVEDASNRMLVLNIIRAVKRYPRHFTDFTKLSGDVPLSGTFALQIPFGGDAASNFIFSPQSTVKSGISFDMKVLNTQEFMRGIITPVSLDTYDFYFRQRWPKAMLFHVFVREVQLKKGMRTKIDDAFKAVCKNNTTLGIVDRICISLLNTDKPSKRDRFCKKNPKDKVCTWSNVYKVEGTDKKLPVKDCKSEIDEADKNNDPYVNYPPRHCEYVRFRILYRMLRVLKAEFEIVRKTVPDPVKTTTKLTDEPTTTKKDNKTVTTWTPKERVTTTEAKPGDSVEFRLSVREDVKEAQKLLGGTKGRTADGAPSAYDAENGEKEKPSITLKLRSPESMIFYLGEVTRVQNRKHEEDTPRYVPKIVFLPEKYRVENVLFQLRKGSPGPEGAAVTVSHEGDTCPIIQLPPLYV